MSIGYSAIGWNRQKKIYDLTLFFLVIMILVGFSAISIVVHPQITAETILIRGSALTAFILLHLVLAIGPLTRIDSRFLPLLYNRRHLGVTLFLVSLSHVILTVFQFHALGDIPARVSFLSSYFVDYLSLGRPQYLNQIPFEPFGFLAILIFGVMALTSHDFWLKNLGSKLWKKMHLFVYFAYLLIVMHVFFGFLQSEQSWFYSLAVSLGMTGLVSLHVWAWRTDQSRKVVATKAEDESFHLATQFSKLREGHGTVVKVNNKKIAIFLDRGQVRALANTCRHQGGPIGEGRIIDGCVTCPWHGWQYKSDTGCSPPPFKEVIATYPVRVVGDDVFVSEIENPLAKIEH